MTTLFQTLRQAILDGYPLYNKGEKKECFEIYLKAANDSLAYQHIVESIFGALLLEAVKEVNVLVEVKKYGEGAWVLRRAFDKILDNKESKMIRLENPEEPKMMSIEDSMDQQKSKLLVDIVVLLQRAVMPGDHTYDTDTYENCFAASEVLEVLSSVEDNEDDAKERFGVILRAGFIRPVLDSNEDSIMDETHLYRFSEQTDLQSALDRLMAKDETPAPGSQDHVAILALQSMLKTFENEEPEIHHDPNVDEKKTDDHELQTEKAQGQEVAQFAASAESVLDIADRKYRLKKYKQCFVGSNAVDKLIQEGLATSRVDAISRMDQLLQMGIIHHVTHDHQFEDANLFYKFSTAADILKRLEQVSSNAVGWEQVEYTALSHRYRQL